MKVSRLLGRCRRRGDLSPLYRVGPMRLVRRVKPWPEAGRHAPSLPAGLAWVSALVPACAGMKLLTRVTGVWIPACAGMTVGYLGFRSARGWKNYFPVISGQFRSSGMPFDRLRMNGGLDVPPLAGGYGRMGGVLLGMGITGAIPDWLCYDRYGRRTSITHGLRAVKNLG